MATYLANENLRNPRHSSPSDKRPHITVRMEIATHIANQSSQTVHIYYDKNTEEYEEFALHSERKENNIKDLIKEERSWETSQSMSLKRRDSM